MQKNKEHQILCATGKEVELSNVLWKHTHTWIISSLKAHKIETLSIKQRLQMWTEREQSFDSYSIFSNMHARHNLLVFHHLLPETKVCLRAILEARLLTLRSLVRACSLSESRAHNKSLLSLAYGAPCILMSWQRGWQISKLYKYFLRGYLSKPVQENQKLKKEIFFA